MTTDQVSEIDDTTLGNAVSVLHRFVADNESKLQNGLRMREQIRLQIQRGERPSHYRYEWLLVTVRDLFTFLGGRCLQFNEEHPGDRCSQQDLYDVLNTALTRVKQK